MSLIMGVDDKGTIVNHDAGSVASSTIVSQVSTSLFSWITGGGGASIGGSTLGGATTSSSVLLAWQKEKQLEISACLNGGGVDDEEVDLWKLRELALSRGGLISSTTRKRAWPKLTGAHEQVLFQKSSSASDLMEVTVEDLEKMEYDVQECVEWHIQDHVKMFRKQQAADDHEERMQQKQLQAINSNSASKSVTFANGPPPGLVGSSSPESEKGSSPGATTVPPSITTSSPEQDTSLLLEEDQDLTVSPMGTCTPNFGNVSSVLGFSSIKKKPKVILSRHEAKILMNLLVSVLRASPVVQQDDGINSRYRYYSGLHNLAALLLINLQSPSLTSLVISKLASFHLRDALMGNQSYQRAVQLTFKPLLKQIDPELYQHIIEKSNVTHFSFVVGWTKCWFAQDADENVRIASRLVDVFLASHALMPIYLSVAILTCMRNKILDTPCNLKSMHMVLLNLPSQLVMLQEEQQEAWEDVIQAAVSYMRQIPPSRLGELVVTGTTSRSDADKTVGNSTQVSSIAMLHESPEWAVSSTAPTDWALLQQAKQMRSRKALRNDNEEEENSPKQKVKVDLDEIQTSYPMAMAASGLEKRKQSKTKMICAMVALFLILAGFGSMWSLHQSGATFVPALGTTKNAGTYGEMDAFSKQEAVVSTHINTKPVEKKKQEVVVEKKQQEKKTASGKKVEKQRTASKKYKASRKPVSEKKAETKPVSKKAVVAKKAVATTKTVSEKVETKKRVSTEKAVGSTVRPASTNGKLPMADKRTKASHNEVSATRAKLPPIVKHLRKGFQWIKSRVLKKTDPTKAVQESYRKGFFEKLLSFVKPEQKIAEPVAKRFKWFGRFVQKEQL